MKKERLGAQSAAEAVSAGSSDRDAASHAAPKHTPGPWHWSDSGLIQTSHLTRDVWRIPRNEADEHLIAAAPELLEALKACAPLWDLGLSDAIKTFVLRHHERVSFDELGERVKAVIAKAEGRH